jgi:outer membrane protein
MKKIIKLGLSLAVFVFLISTVPAFAADDIKIGIVDVKTVIKESKAGKKAKSKMEDEIADRKKTLDKKEKAVKKLAKELQDEKYKMAREKKAERLNKDIKELKRLKADYQEEIKRMDRRLGIKLANEILDVARKVGKKEGYTIIIQNNPDIVYLGDGVDITGKVLKEFERSRRN